LTRAGTPVDLASRLGLAMSTLITVVKNCEVIERSYIQYGTSCKQWKYLLLEELESAQISF
jgi:hypothetical protein